MKPRFLIGIFLALPLAAGVFSVSPAHAAGSDCTILPSDLNAVTAAEAEGITAELAARRSLLTKTIQCAKADARSLTDQLNALSVGPGGTDIRTQLLGQLSDAENYYDIELGKVNDAGIAGTQAIARDLLAWRTANYAPLTDQISNFMLWGSNQALMEAANTRLGQIRNIVSFLENAGPQADLENLLGSATVLVNNANSENDAARNALLQLLPPNQSLDFIKQSLASLADAYTKFADMSAAIQKLLPAASPSQ